MKLLSKMYALVATEFQNKIDREGRPYFEHCLHVMQTCGLNDENSLCIALGHDLLEDTDIAFEYLLKEFNSTIANGINCLTHKIGNYEDYIKTIPTYPFVNKQCIKIKLADLKHNMNISRLKVLTDKDFDRMKKYIKAYDYLSNILKQYEL